MTDSEYNARQRSAYFRLREIGEHRRAQEWIRKNPPPPEWTGTPLEYAWEEMPIGLLGRFLEWLVS
jgi:hypothetical protein